MITVHVKGAAGKAGDMVGQARDTVTEQLPAVTEKLPGAVTKKLPRAAQPDAFRWAGLSTSEAVLEALRTLKGPVSATAIQTVLKEHGRDETIGHIETALAMLAERKLVIKHGPALWEATPES